ncbi:O-antigen ligase family protein [Thalassotalea mangrovi]|uniref:O-antigen ligase family protein n=1 Tax=Thalassotalea mangrovi TaxID=2572245 RepID=A0A4U1B6K0_9GAMM|nr:O-antigen ligase family protein [Thalassotalea mangrovi]TKB46145.1 O-antigen ligase family protein [Thalassotalea mangrovi]
MKKWNINYHTIWIYLLVFSFSFEKPLIVLSSLDRLNPRLFDLVLGLGILILINNRLKFTEVVFKYWLLIVANFWVCAVLGLLLFDFSSQVKLYMVYYCFEYFKGVLALAIYLTIPEKYRPLRVIVNALFIGGFFVGTYCLYEYFIGIEQIVLTEGLILSKPKELVWGPFSGSYFHIANYIPLISAICLSKMIVVKSNKIFWFVVFLFFSWPILFTGSRTAIFLFIASVFFVFAFYIRKKTTVWLLLFFTIFTSVVVINTSFIASENYTLERLNQFEENDSHNSILNRVLFFSHFDISSYDEGEYLPFIGAGFYVAPIEGRPRVGYGFHNIYVFTIEQSGIIGFCLFIMFCFVVVRRFVNFIKVGKVSKYHWFVVAVTAYTLGSLVIGWSGHTFWRGFATSNFNTLRILLLVSCSLYITKSYLALSIFKKNN